MSMNYVFIRGNVATEVKYKTFKNDTIHLSEFNLAFNDTYGKSRLVSYFKCQAWGKNAQIVSRNIKKGSGVTVIGSLKQNRWYSEKARKHRSSVHITCAKIIFNSTIKWQRKEKEKIVLMDQVDAEAEIQLAEEAENEKLGLQTESYVYEIDD